MPKFIRVTRELDFGNGSPVLKQDIHINPEHINSIERDHIRWGNDKNFTIIKMIDSSNNCRCIDTPSQIMEMINA